VIAEQPEAKRFGGWVKKPQHEVARWLAEAYHHDPNEIPLIGTYRFKHTRCGGYSDSPREAARYKKWYRKFAQGVGNNRVVIFYEIDALITVKCLSARGLRTRISEMRSAIASLSRLPHAVVYVDAGSGLAHGAAYMAAKLRQVGVHKIQGFFTNATHQNRTLKEITYARDLVRRTGGRAHYVINTSGNGRGPKVPHNRVARGNSYRCNAPGRGLGPKPTWDVPAKYKGLDGLFWIGNPGRSAGRCAQKAWYYRGVKVPDTGQFWLRYALELIRYANFRIT